MAVNIHVCKINCIYPFLSRLRGGEPIFNIKKAPNSFLSRLRGGEPSNPEGATQRTFLSRLRGGERKKQGAKVC